jgi:hypothetical protein
VGELGVGVVEVGDHDELWQVSEWGGGVGRETRAYPVGDGEPGDAVVFDDVGGAKDGAGIGDEGGHGEDACVGDDDGIALAGVEEDGVGWRVGETRGSG